MMARTLKSNSYMGEFYDAMGGYTMCAFPLLSIGLCAYHTGRNIILNLVHIESRFFFSIGIALFTSFTEYFMLYILQN